MLAYAAFIASYMAVRPKGVISVIDMFVLLFSLQFGPHAIIKHPFLDSALLVPDIYPKYALGLTLAYSGLAGGLYLTGSALRLQSIDFSKLSNQDITHKTAPIVAALGIFYVLFFIAFQGFDLSRTLSYLNFFKGDTTFTYTELRRELFEEDSALSLTAVTRQTASALLYGALIYAGLKAHTWRPILFAIAVLLFVVCCMQMNKFPVFYYTMITGLIVYMDRCYTNKRFLTKKVVVKAIAIAALLLGLLTLLYNFQYGSELSSGVVTGDRIFFRVISRPFAGNHDSLYLWFANFPDTFGYIGFTNIGAIANLLGVPQFSPTVEIPALYVAAKTTFQAGYIGGAYASFGYPGIICYSIIAGSVVCLINYYEGRLKRRWQRIVYFAVLGMNCYFLSSRELHTALQSGGLLLAPLVLLIFNSTTKLLKVRRRPRRIISNPNRTA